MRVTRAYLEKKFANKDIVYLFKNGAFYLALNEDALFLRHAGWQNKIISFGTYDVKMGFPISEREKLERILKEEHIEYEFVDDYTPTDYNEYVDRR